MCHILITFIKMLSLKSEKQLQLSDSTLKALVQNRITTILDFLQEEPEKLSVLMKISLPKVLTLKNSLLTKYSARICDASSLLRKCFESGVNLSTGIDRGGIPKGYISELCGLPGSGKTQFCLQLAINCARTNAQSVLYLDTKGDFSAIRVQKILDGYGFSHKDMAVIMHRIKVVNIWNMEELIEFLKQLKNKTVHFDNLSLIIIDSLPSLMFQHLGDDNKIGLSLLNHVVNYSRYLCKEFNIAFICVNIQTRWVDQEAQDIDDDAEPTILNEFIEKRNRCLGKYWQHIPALVLQFEKSQSHEANSEVSQIDVNILKSNFGNVAHTCSLTISNSGVL